MTINQLASKQNLERASHRITTGGNCQYKRLCFNTNSPPRTRLSDRTTARIWGLSRNGVKNYSKLKFLCVGGRKVP